MSWGEVLLALNRDPKVPLDELIKRGAVKSVQRGNYAGDSASGNSGVNTANRTITINRVDLSKAILLVNGDNVYNPSDKGGAYLANETTISIPYKQYNYYDQGNGYNIYTYTWPKFAWQVIEFY